MPEFEHSRISLCMITRDEEAFLGRCLASVRALVDEIIVVDTGSTDRTISIAQQYSARIFHHPWEDDFSKHRNQSLSYATGDWILVMDADEVIAPRDLNRIRSVLTTVAADGFYFTLRNYENTSNLANFTVNPRDYEEGAGFPGFIGTDLIRLFRNDPLIRFTGQVHETVTQTMRQSKKNTFITGIPIHHYGKMRQDRVKPKQDVYLALGYKRLAENPSDPMAYKGLSDQLLELGLLRDALDIADCGLAVYPDLLDLHFNRGLALDRIGRESEAMQEYLWVHAIRPDHLGACHNLGQMLLRHNKIEESIPLLRMGIERGLKHPAVYFLLGQAYAAAGDDREALDNFARALELQPTYPNVHCHRAIIFLNHNRYDEALKELEIELDMRGNCVAAYTILGEISLYWKDRDSAINFFLRVLNLDPDNPKAREYLDRLAHHCSNPSCE